MNYRYFADKQIDKSLSYIEKDLDTKEWKYLINLLKVNLSKFENGVDFDKNGVYTISNIINYANILLENYKRFPEGDNRNHYYLNNVKRIGLDIDDVIADWSKHWIEKFNINALPKFWNFDREINKKFDMLKEDKDFWLTIPPKIKSDDMPFEPTCYITSRNIPNEWTIEWLNINGFPGSPLYTVGHNVSKVEISKREKIDIFIDDRYENFIDLNKNNICCFLLDCLHNRKYNVGYKRIYSLKEIVDFI